MEVILMMAIGDEDCTLLALPLGGIVRLESEFMIMYLSIRNLMC